MGNRFFLLGLLAIISSDVIAQSDNYFLSHYSPTDERIQFIQTTINSPISVKSSPVMDFFIQVSIALLVFPVELVARSTLQKVVQNKYSVQRLFNNPED